VREALDRGHNVTVIVRDPGSVQTTHQRLQLRQGDVLDSPQISRLIAGQDVVVNAVGSARAKTPDRSLYRKAAESLGRSGGRLQRPDPERNVLDPLVLSAMHRGRSRGTLRMPM
jgi:uncharacterized protein YbjT (DUF2867 family)